MHIDVKPAGFSTSFRRSIAAVLLLAVCILIARAIVFDMESRQNSEFSRLSGDGLYFVGECALYSQRNLDKALNQIRNTTRRRVAIEVSLGKNIGDIDLSGLVDTPQISELILDSVSNNSIQTIPSNCNLETVRLFGSGTTNSGVQHLLQLPKLSTLRVDSCNVDDQALEAIGQNTQLTELSLCDSRISDLGLPYLENLKGLKSLDLSRTFVTDEGIDSLLELTELQNLSLRETAITNRTLKALGKMHSLQSIELDGTLISDEGVNELAMLPNLRVLKLKSCDIGYSPTPWNRGFSKLEKVELTNTNAGDEVFLEIGRNRKLVAISIDLHSISYDNSYEDRLGKRILVRNYLSDADNWILNRQSSKPITNLFWHHAGLLPFLGNRIAQQTDSIDRLYLAQSDVTDKDVEALPPLPCLEEVNVEHTQISDLGLIALTKHQNLCKIMLDGCKVRDLRPLVNLPNLRSLSLDGFQLNDETINLIEKLPKLESVFFRDVRCDWRKSNWVNVADLRAETAKSKKESSCEYDPFSYRKYEMVYFGLRSGLKEKSVFKMEGVWDEETTKLLNANGVWVRSLTISDLKLTQSMVDTIGSLPALRELVFLNCEIPTGSLRRIARVPYLSSLSFRGSTLVNESLEALSELKYLRQLWLGQNQVNIADIEMLRKMEHLRCLALLQVTLSDPIVGTILAFSGLSELQLSDRRFEERELSSIRRLSRQKLKDQTFK